MTTINLDLLFERVLRSLMLCCDGRTTSMEGRVTGGEPNRDPLATEVDERGRPDYTIDSLIAEYKLATSSVQRREIISRALEAVRQAKWSPAPPDGPLRGSREWREVIALDPRPISVIGRDVGVSRPTIYKYKREFGIAA